MKIRGTVFSGAMRGGPLIEKYHARLIGILGVRVFLGTLDVRMERNVDIRPFARKTIEHILPGGTAKHKDANIAEIKIRKLPVAYDIMALRASQKESIKNLQELKQTAKERMDMNVSPHELDQGYNCWALQFSEQELDVIEIIAKEHLKSKLNLHDGDTLEIEFFEKR